jgi:hypothetical protein
MGALDMRIFEAKVATETVMGTEMRGCEVIGL